MRRALALSALLAAVPALAREYTELFPTPRAKSMGFAMTAIVDDYNSMYTNPAGLAQMEGWELRLPDVAQASVSPSALDLYRSLKGIGGSASSIASSLSDFDGKSACGGVDLLGMGYFSRRFAVAVNTLSANGCFRVRTPSIFFAKVQARVTADSGLSLAHAQSALNDRLRFGIALRPFVVRAGMDRTLENTDILKAKGDSIKKFMGVGWGFDLDLGVQGTLKSVPFEFMQLRPTWGVAIQNALATNFSNQLQKGLDATPPALERKLNAGVGVAAENFGAFRPTASFELRDLTIQTDSWIEHISTGVELALRPRKWFRTALRGHYYKGNFGGGFGMKLTALEIELGTYAVNLGRGPGVGVDRRIYLQTSLVW